MRGLPSHPTLRANNTHSTCPCLFNSEHEIVSLVSQLWAINAKDGSVTAFMPDATPAATPISAAEGVTADAVGNIYGAVVPARMVQKHVRR
jgi:hypothetical protein